MQSLQTYKVEVNVITTSHYTLDKCTTYHIIFVNINAYHHESPLCANLSICANIKCESILERFNTHHGARWRAQALSLQSGPTLSTFSGANLPTCKCDETRF